MQNEERVARRRETLRAHGAEDRVIDELLEYNHSTFAPVDQETLADLPLADEPCVAAWRNYAQAANESSVLEELGRRLVQLRFPIREGISQSPTYRDATLKGRWPSSGEGLVLEHPEQLTLTINPTHAGALPVLVSDHRADFERLVQALTFRNEPRPVPESMGACIVGGLNNWDRIASHRRAWEATLDRAPSPTEWNEEFARFRQNKGNYQDRVIILSTGPYSAVTADRMGLSEDSWLDSSLVIRREHECAHYLTLRVLGSMRNNLIDELFADYAGLVSAFGRYSSDVALRFLGIEPGHERPGRIDNYRGDPPLSDPSFAVLKRLMVAATRALESFHRDDPVKLSEPGAVAGTILGLARLTLEEIASFENGQLELEELS